MPTLLLSDATPKSIVSAAEARGFDVISVPSADGMAHPVASHPDMLFFCGFGRFFARRIHLESKKFADIAERMEHLGYVISQTSDQPSVLYPADVAFNCFTIPQTALIGKADFISGAVKRAATEARLPVIDTKQGYTKCSSAVITGNGRSDSLIITSDPSIIKTGAECGISTLKISVGHVSLPGYDTGFIGGASFATNDTLYFLGDVSRHPDFISIVTSAEALGRDVVSLSDEPLFDAGCLYIK